MTRDTSEFNAVRYGEEQPLFGSELKRVETVLKLIGSGNTVLDLGCWDGSISKLIMERGNTVYGLENSKAAVNKATAKGIIVKQFDLESEVWPSFENPFDVIYAGEIIEHVFDTDQFLQKIRKLLKENGNLVLTTPNIAAFGRRLMLLCGINPLIETTAREYDAGHIRYFTKKLLFTLLEENGFLVKNFQSDIVNFSNSGYLYSSLMAHLFPTFGRSLIVKVAKQP